MFQWAEIKAKPVMRKRKERVNLSQQGSAVLDRTGFTSDQRIQKIEASDD